MSKEHLLKAFEGSGFDLKFSGDSSSVDLGAFLASLLALGGSDTDSFANAFGHASNNESSDIKSLKNDSGEANASKIDSGDVEGGSQGKRFVDVEVFLSSLLFAASQLPLTSTLDLTTKVQNAAAFIKVFAFLLDFQKTQGK